MIEIPALVSTAWTVLQPYLPLLATKAAEEVGKNIPTTVGKIWGAIKKKFDTKEAAREALEDLLKDPKSEESQMVFKVQLKKALKEDDRFVAELTELLQAAGSDFKAKLDGAGAIAQGAGAKAVGKNGVLIDGDVSNSNIISGNNNRVNHK